MRLACSTVNRNIDWDSPALQAIRVGVCVSNPAESVYYPIELSKSGIWQAGASAGYLGVF